MPDDDLIDKLLAQLPAPYPLSTGRSSNETSLPSVRREGTGMGYSFASFITLIPPSSLINHRRSCPYVPKYFSPARLGPWFKQ